MTLIYDNNDPQKAQTHAFVVGVNFYRHFGDGSNPQTEMRKLRLKQLSSPTVSARAMVDWLLTHFHNEAAPLGSVELLLSASTPSSYTPPAAVGINQEINVERATIHEVMEAAREWRDRCNQHRENCALFYFCGHGLVVRGDHLLLAEDVGEDDLSPFENAINISKAQLGMGRIKARLQCYFVDACRQVPTVGQGFTDMQGQTWITPEPIDQLPRDSLVLNASSENAQAFADPDNASHFTKALLSALGGRGAREEAGNWGVYTDTLGSTVVRLVRRSITNGGPPQISTAGGETTGEFLLHRLEETPVVEVTVRLQPPEADGAAEVTLRAVDESGLLYRRLPGATRWEPPEVRVGIYHFKARFAGGEFRDVEKLMDVDLPFCEESFETEALP